MHLKVRLVYFLDIISAMFLGRILSRISIHYRDKICSFLSYEEKDMLLDMEVENVIKNVGRREKNDRLIVIVSEYTTPRTVKIVSALSRLETYQVVFIDCAVDKRSLKELSACQNIDIKRCTSFMECLKLILKYDPLVYYYFPAWGDCYNLDALIRHKKSIGKIVTERYDVLGDGYLGYQQEIKREKYALENADGVVWRYFSKELLEQKGYKFRGKSIQFVDWCGNYQIVNETHYDEKVKLCWVVSHAEQMFGKNDICGEYCTAMIPEIMEKIGDRDDYELHAFVWSISPEMYKAATEYEKIHSNFKLYVGIEHDDLIKMLANYDYGIRIFMKNPDNIDQVNVLRQGDLYDTCSINAYFDYLDAELMPIATAGTKLCDFLEEYDAIIRWELQDFNLDYLKEHKAEFKKKAKFAKKRLSIYEHIEELTGMFEEVAK